MGSLKRKIERKKILKSRKHNKKNLKRATSALAGTPTNCTECSAVFDPKTDADDWVVHFSPQANMISLFCPKCAP